jgi:hypothetical protein
MKCNGGGDEDETAGAAGEGGGATTTSFASASSVRDVYKLTREHGGFVLLKTCITKIVDIYRDHVSEPLTSIYTELFTKSGRMDVTDRKARVDAIESLKRMIHS